MDKRFPTTPAGVFPTPLALIVPPDARTVALAAFDEGLAQMQRLQRAEACIDPTGFDAALLGYEAEAADARALADQMLEDFLRSDKASCWHLSTAAWLMLVLLESDGLNLSLIAQRSAGLRRVAAACARSPLPEEIESADRLLASAEVIDLMIAAAIDDYAAIDPDRVDDLRGLVGRGLAAAIDRTQEKHSPDNPDCRLEPEFGPC